MNKSVTFTIFGGTGDLTYRKLLPALYNLFVSSQLTDFNVVIVGRRNYDSKSYSTIVQPWIKEFARLEYSDVSFKTFFQHVIYYQMDFTDVNAYDELSQFYVNHHFVNPVFYLAVAPHFFATITSGLERIRDVIKGSVVIEKPFGENLNSAKELNVQLEKVFTRENIYHIDHYLGKEMVRNILTIRFTNPIFTSIWNHHYIDHIDINAFETVGVETRGNYYDKSGALKDMVQNHLLQILSIVAMEPLDTFTVDAIHQRQLEVLHQLRSVDKVHVEDMLVMGQYEGYRNEANVNEHSTTETYAALKLFIDNKRWKDVPFYVRTGKKTSKREMEVVITFKQLSNDVSPNVLVIKIQPTEGVYLQFNIKQPGNSEAIIPTQMDFCQSCNDVFRINTPEAYERLLMAVVCNDRSLFSSWEIIETSWHYIDQMKQKALDNQLPVYVYTVGSDGPQTSNQF